jgi:tetratricopeptide (TPR) repeat protein
MRENPGLRLNPPRGGSRRGVHLMANDLLKLQRTPREVARWQKAQQQVLGNRHAPALANYRDLVQHYPGVAQLWFELGIAALGALELGSAEEAFARAEKLAWNDVPLLVLLGQQYHRLRRVDRARACFERAVATNPSSMHARLSLAAWYERERRLQDAFNCVEACLAQHPENPQVWCVRALLLHRQGRNSEAETLLRDLIRRAPSDPNVNYSSCQLLGVVLDELGHYTEALHWLSVAKAQARQMADTVRMERDYDEADRRRRALLAALSPDTIQRWRREAVPNSSDRPLALLGGHPRSGTTLLEQILGAHPGIRAFDEPEAFVQEVWNQLAPMPPAPALTLEALNALGSDRQAELRRRYFKSLLREAPTEPTAQVWLDKNPSPTTALYLWLRLFPGLKVIIALRDPRDVIISCFFQNLMLTPTNANFLSLERTAKHYADLMDVWLRLRDLGGFDWLETRYEDLVANLEPEGRRVTEFLGLAWHPNQANHQEVTRHKFLFAPTFSDVAKPVYQRAVGRWQHYAEALAPLQERLAPYCRALGYR